MARVNVSIPDELYRRVRAELGGLNLSAVLRDGLAGLLRCDHDRLECRRCAAPVERLELVDETVGRFYRDALGALESLMHNGGTVEGSARVLKEVASRWGVSAAATTPLPRLPRAARAALLASRVADLPTPAQRGRRARRTA